MTRQYHKRNDYSQPKYCACGCGMELTRDQIRNGNKFASYACSARFGNSLRAQKRKKMECHCGCGEEVPYKNRIKHYYYVNENHEKLHRHRIDNEQYKKELQEQENQNNSYCKNYKEGYSTCILCYGNRDGMYRGCYDNPKIPKKK